LPEKVDLNDDIDIENAIVRVGLPREYFMQIFEIFEKD